MVRSHPSTARMDVTRSISGAPASSPVPRLCEDGNLPASLMAWSCSSLRGRGQERPGGDHHRVLTEGVATPPLRTQPGWRSTTWTTALRSRSVWTHWLRPPRPRAHAGGHRRAAACVRERPGMAAVRLRLRCEPRAGWPAWLALAVVLGLPGRPRVCPEHRARMTLVSMSIFGSLVDPSGPECRGTASIRRPLRRAG